MRDRPQRPVADLPEFTLRILLLLFCLCISAASQKLPFKSYTTADGLAHNNVDSIFQDKKGFLWFGTDEGLSRFDGYDFVNFRTADGLPADNVNAILEDDTGRIWVGTDGGIGLLVNQKPGATSNAKFEKILIDPDIPAANSVVRMLIDSSGKLWLLTWNGVYNALPADDPLFTLVAQFHGSSSRTFFQDSDNNIWFGVGSELREIRNGEIIEHGSIDGDQNDFVINGMQSKRGPIIILSRTKGLFEFDPKSSRWTQISQPTISSNFWALTEDADNNIWFGGRNVLTKQTGRGTTEYSFAHGIKNDNHLVLFQDRERNLWGGRGSLGVFKLPANPIVSYPFDTEAYSLGMSDIDGTIFSYFCERNDLARFDLLFCTPRSRELSSRDTPSVKTFGILPFAKDFVIYTQAGLWGIYYDSMRAAEIIDTTLKMPGGAVFDLKDLFAKPINASDDAIFHIIGDTLWVGRSDGSIHRIDAKPSGSTINRYEWNSPSRPTILKTDPAGDLWLFSKNAPEGRIRKDGRFEALPRSDNFPASPVSAFFDSRGWLWVGTSGNGVFVSEDPLDASPAFRNYSTEFLLSSTIEAIIEDDRGDMYFGTAKGLNRYNVDLNTWKSFTTKDGLTGDGVNGLFKDSSGNIWINAQYGLSTLDPKRVVPSSSPPIYINRIRIAGEDLFMNDTAAGGNAEPVSLSSSQNNLTIDFVGIQFEKENALRYQYKLEGIDRDWSTPTKNRSIALANLADGNYRFMVRAINEDGIASEQPAFFGFRIFPPVYLRWWFLLLAAFTFLTAVYAIYRLRLKRLLEIERMRRVIAGDLHDDIGSDLSKISVLSEVARMRSGGGAIPNDDLLNSIAEIARGAVGSMSDIVWATNPERDSVREMIRKMREHAEEIFVIKNVQVNFADPLSKYDDMKLPMDLRRNLYLIFKEAINNAAKHSECSKIDIAVDILKREVNLFVADNGKGFDASKESTGNGLHNMRSRVQGFGGNIQILSDSKIGTVVTVKLPVR